MSVPRHICWGRYGFKGAEILALTFNPKMPPDFQVTVTEGTIFKHLEKDASETGCGIYLFHRNYQNERVHGERVFNVWRKRNEDLWL